MLEHLTLLLALAAAVCGIAWLVWSRRAPSQARHAEEAGTVVSDWTPTGKIDFVAAEEMKDEGEPATFTLNVEEYRVLESISGTRRVEVRWRKAKLIEAKRVASAHNAPARSDGNREREIAGLIEGPSIVPHAAAGGDNLHPDGAARAGNGSAR